MPGSGCSDDPAAPFTLDDLADAAAALAHDVVGQPLVPESDRMSRAMRSPSRML